MPKRDRAEYMRQYRARKREEARLKRIKEAEERGEYDEDYGDYAETEENGEMAIIEEPEGFTGIEVKEQKTTRTCVVCGVEYFLDCEGCRKGIPFCSKECRRKWRQMRVKERQRFLDAYQQTKDYKKTRGQW